MEGGTHDRGSAGHIPTSPNNYIRQPACVCGSSDAPTAIADPRRSQSFFRWLAVLPSARLAVAGLLPVAAGPRCRQRDRMDVHLDWVSGSTSAWLVTWSSVALRAPPSTTVQWSPAQLDAAVGCSASAVARVCTCVGAAVEGVLGTAFPTLSRLRTDWTHIDIDWDSLDLPVPGSLELMRVEPDGFRVSVD